MSYPECPKIFKSTNYSAFKKIEWNRSINLTNYKKLLDENKKDFQLHKFPIIVSSDLKIIDGQHRFEVSRELGSPVYYIVDNSEISFNTVHSVNKAGKKHGLTDKIEMLYKAGDAGAKVIYKIYNEFNCNFHIYTIAQLLASGTDGGGLKDMIDKTGKITLSNYEDGLEVLNVLNKSNIPKAHDKRMVFAFYYIVKNYGITPKALKTRIEFNIIKWIDPKSTQEAVRVMKNCYNYGLSKNNRIGV